MQDQNAKNKLAKIFKKSNNQPQEYSSTKEHPLFFRLETDPQMRKKVEGGLNNKISSEITSITIDYQYFEKLIKEVERLKPLDGAFEAHDIQIKDLQEQIEDLRKQNQDESKGFARLEREHEREKQVLNAKIDDLNEIIKDKDENMRMFTKKIQEQNEEINKLKTEKLMLEGRLASRGNEVDILKSKLNEIYDEYKKYRRILYPNLALKEQIDQDKADAGEEEHPTSIADVEIEKVVDLTYLFSDKIGLRVSEFLEYREMLNLRRISKYMKICIDNNPQFYLIMAKQIRTKWHRVQSDILKRVNFHKDQAASISSNYIRHTFIKYIRVKEIAGDYMPKVIEQTQDLIKLVEEMGDSLRDTTASSEINKYEALPSEQTPKSFMSFFWKSNGQNKPKDPEPSFPASGNQPRRLTLPNQPTDLLAGDPMLSRLPADQTESLRSGQGEISESTKESLGHYAYSPTYTPPTNAQNEVDVVKKREEENKNRDPDLPEDEIDTAEIKENIFKREWEDNPWCVFIPADSFQNFNKDKEQMLQKARGHVERLLTDMNKKKQVISGSKEFLLQFIQCFVKLFIYSRVLLQETRELEGLKDYVVSKYEEVKEKLMRYENFVEDHGQALDTEKQLRRFFEKRSTELEAELHKNNARILRDSENMVLTQNHLKTITQEMEDLKKEKLDCEAKLKKVVKEVKNLRGKNKDLEENTSRVMSGYLDIKIAFDNLNIEF